MDEGSGERQERDRDGWSEESGCTGAQLQKETIHRCTEEIWERLWKNDKSRSWRRRDNEHDREEGVCLCVKGIHRGQEGEKREVYWTEFEREREMCARKFTNKEIQEKLCNNWNTEDKKQIEAPSGERTIKKQIRPAQHVLLHPPHLGWWHYSNHSPSQYLWQHIGDQSKCQDRIDHAQSNVT